MPQKACEGEFIHARALLFYIARFLLFLEMPHFQMGIRKKSITRISSHAFWGFQGISRTRMDVITVVA